MNKTIRYKTNTMENILSILVVDDQPITIIGYEHVLKNMQKDFEVNVVGAYDCDEVLSKMKGVEFRSFDIVFLETLLPPSRNGLVINGEDLAIKIRHSFPQVKIVVQTELTNQKKISSILKNLKPEGFLIKSDIEPEVLLDVVSTVINGDTYYSKTVKKLISPCNGEKIFLDSADQKILYHLSKGERMKNLPKHVHLAIAFTTPL